MEARQLSVLLKGLEDPRGEPSDSLVCTAALEDLTVELSPGLRTSLPLQSLDASLIITILDNTEPLSTVSIPLSNLLGTEHSFNQWLTFPSDPAFRLHLEGSLKQRLTVKPQAVPSTGCTYLTELIAADQLVNSSRRILDYLQQETGHMFQKVLQESVRLRSPQKSPTKQTGNKASRQSKRTPTRKSSSGSQGKSPYARGINASFVSEKEEPIEVPALAFRNLESVSNSDFTTLVMAVVALQATKSLVNSVSAQETPTQTLSQAMAEATDDIYKALEETQQQNDAHLENYQGFLKVINALPYAQKLQSVNKAIEFSQYTKEGLNLLLHKLVCNSSVDIPNPPFEDLKSNEDSANSTYKARASDCTSLSEDIAQFKSTLADIEAESQALSTEKARLGRSLEAEISQGEQTKQEIRKLKNQIREAEGSLELQTAFTQKIQESQAQGSEHRQLTQQLSTDQTSLTRHSEDNYAKARVTLANLENALIVLDAGHKNASRLLETESSTSSTLAENVHGVEASITSYASTVAQLETVDTKLHDSEASLEATCEHEAAMSNELDFLADFSFKWSQQSLNGHRVYRMIQSLKEDRIHDIVSMKEALVALKNKFPMYSGDKTDPIDAALEFYLNQSDRTLLVPFTRQGPGIYLFGTKQVMIKLERNKLQAKVGGGFLPLDDFIEAYQMLEKEKLLVKTQEYSPTAKKFMGKWAEGVIDARETSPVRMRESLVGAMEGKVKPSVLAVREKHTVKRSKTMTPAKPIVRRKRSDI